MNLEQSANPHDLSSAIDRARLTLQEAYDNLAAIALHEHTGQVHALLESSANPKAATARDALLQAEVHLSHTTTALAEGIGELTLYAAETTRPGVAPLTIQVAEQSAPDNDTEKNAADNLLLDFSREELMKLLADDGLPRDRRGVIKHGKIYELLEYPGLVLRRASAGLVMDKIGTPAQKMAHIERYEAELRRLHRLGVPVLRHITHMVHTHIRSQSIIYTVVEHHPDAVNNLQTRINNHPTPELEQTILSTALKLMKYYTSGDEIIWDIDKLEQYAADGTLLDYDPYLSDKLNHRLNALASVKSWLYQISKDNPERSKLVGEFDILLQDAILHSLRR